MDKTAILDILILAAIAGFILYRLWSVLGQRTGHERPPERRPGEAVPRRVGPVAAVPASEKPVAVAPRPMPNHPPIVERGLSDIAGADRAFDPAGFVSGAQAAHERVLESFAAGDKGDLRSLLTDDVYKAFASAIEAREAKGWIASTTIVKQGQPTIAAATLKGRMAEVVVRYESEIIQFAKDASGDVVEGSDVAVKTVIDRWTWVRDVRSGDPNWKLDVTETGD